MSLNPKKVGLFKGGFFLGGDQFDPPLHISRRTYLISINFMQLLNNLSKVD